MPDRGRLTANDIAAGPLLAEGELAAPWRLTGARWLQVTFEVDREALLDSLPEDVNRPVPPYARLFVLEAEGTPAGPLRLAALLANGRFRMLPHNVLVEGIAEGAAREVAQAFGAPWRAGYSTLERETGGISASVAGEDGQELCRVQLPAPRAIDAAMLRWDPWLGYAGPGDNIDLVEYQLHPEITQAYLSKGATIEMAASLPGGNVWRRFRNLNTISACYCEGSLTISAPEVLQAI